MRERSAATLATEEPRSSFPDADFNAIEAAIASAVDGLDLPAGLLDAVRYAALGPGKRLRPVLCLLACRLVADSPLPALPAAAALEMVHAFSLVHDDLPCMDDDDLRRGRPTTHIAFGEPMALLAGDVLLSGALQHLVTAVPDPDLSAALVRELSTATTGMVAGQVYDTLGGFPADLGPADRMRLMHRLKTGALIKAACRMGVMSGLSVSTQTDPEDQARAIERVTDFGDAIGLMFQVVDDLLDVEQSAEHVGKAVRKDQAAGKLTYPVVLGVERSRHEVAQLRARAEAVLATFGNAAAPLIEMTAYLAERTR